MIRFLHTADWHIGQLFHQYDRREEHQQFLNWLLDTLEKEQIDVLLISGDVYDNANPSAASIKMLYAFLNKAITRNPALQIVMTAGNHDSAARLESPKPLLESSNVHIVGLIKKDTDGAIDYSQITLPIRDKEGQVKAWCIAAPFLRMGDYPTVPNASNPYTEGVTAFYKEAYAYAQNLRQDGQAIIALGHLHAQQAEVSDSDQMERLIMGGVESIGASAFDKDISYVALGHIHKAQRIGGQERIRYSGSPIPMSFSETNYKHQVMVFDLEGTALEHLRPLAVPVSIPLLRVPDSHQPLTAVLEALEVLEADPEVAPYLEVRVLLDGPRPELRHKVEEVLKGKHYRLAKIDVRLSAGSKKTKQRHIDPEALQQLQPEQVLEEVYQHRYQQPLPDDLRELFIQVSGQLNDLED